MMRSSDSRRSLLTSNCWRSPTFSRRGLSLLEVLISLAVFLAATAAIGQLVAQGSRAAIQAQVKTEAILKAESYLSEVVAGAVPLQSHAAMPCADDPNWTSALTIASGPHADLVLVEVTVTRAVSTGTTADSFTLTRLMRDPQALLNTTATTTSTVGSLSSGSTSTTKSK